MSPFHSALVAPGTRAGQQLRLTSRGMTRGSTSGHLYAVVRIEVPTVIDDEARALYQKLAETSNFDPRGKLAQEAPQ